MPHGPYPPPTPKLEELDPKLAETFDLFTAAMRGRLAQKAAQGHRGWGHPDFHDEALWRAARHTEEMKTWPTDGRMVDAANYILFAWATMPNKVEKSDA